MSAGAFLYSWQYLARQWIAGRWMRFRQLSGRVATVAPDFKVNPPNRIALIVCGLIGDTVMSTPVIVEARRLWPEAKIVLLGQKHNCELLSASPLIDYMREVVAIPFTLRKAGELGRLKKWIQLQQFDLAIILLGDQFAKVLAEAGIPARVGVNGHVLQPFLTHSYDIGSARTWGPSERLNALRCLGYEVQNVSPQLWVSEMARISAQQKLAELGLSQGTPFVVVHPFGRTERQWWSLDRVGVLADEFLSCYGLRTVLVGGAKIQNAIPEAIAKKVINTCGLISLQELLAVVQGASLVVSTDSGPFHVAGALARPVIGLFRAQRPEHANHYPQGSVIFGHDESCQRHCEWDHCQAQPCRQLEGLTAQAVLNVVKNSDVMRTITVS